MFGVGLQELLLLALMAGGLLIAVVVLTRRGGGGRIRELEAENRRLRERLGDRG